MPKGKLSKLSTFQVDEICRRYRAGESIQALGRIFEVCDNAISYWLKRRVVPRRSLIEAQRIPHGNAEVQRRWSESALRRWRNPTIRRLYIEARLKEQGTPEARQRNREAQKKRFMDPEMRRQHIEAQRTQEARRRKSESIKNSPKAKAQRDRIRRAAKPNNSERRLYGLLDEIGVPYLKEHTIGTYFADVFVPSRNLAIECDGYYHGLPERIVTDCKRNKFLSAIGIKTVRVLSGSIDSGDALPVILNALGVVGKNRDVR